MSKVIKKNGVYILEPDPKLVAKSKSAEDLESVKTVLTDEDLRKILERILTRLRALENS